MYGYVITNRVNGKQYVGQTRVSVLQRLRQHVQDAGRTPFARALRKYGLEVFYAQHAPLPLHATQELLNEIEVRLISHLNTLVPHGYNLRSGGASGEHHQESRAKMSASHTGKSMPLEAREKIRQTLSGRPQPPELVAKRAAILLGKRRSPEVRARMSGRRVSDETRSRISTSKSRQERSEAMRAAWARVRASGLPWMPPETRAKMAAAMSGIRRGPLSDEVKAKLRASHLGKRHSDEVRARMSAAHTGKMWSELRCSRFEARRARQKVAA